MSRRKLTEKDREAAKRDITFPGKVILEENGLVTIEVEIYHDHVTGRAVGRALMDGDFEDYEIEAVLNRVYEISMAKQLLALSKEGNRLRHQESEGQALEL